MEDLASTPVHQQKLETQDDREKREPKARKHPCTRKPWCGGEC